MREHRRARSRGDRGRAAAAAGQSLGGGGAPGGLTVAVRVERIAAGGDGVGRLPDGQVVFVPRTAPGDLVDLADLRPGRRMARARLGELREAGPGRVAPPCVHYVRDDCGGCQLQHLDAPTQQAARRRIVGDALRRLARLDLPDDPPLEAAPEPWGYRTRITVHAAADGRRLGFHRLGAAGRLVDLEDCLLAAAPVRALWRAVRPRRGLLPPGLETLTLREGGDGRLHVVAAVRAGSSAWTRAEELAGALAAAGVEATLWWAPADGAARVVAGPRGDVADATAFAQVHPVMAERVRHHALAALGDVAERVVWDLYAGVGESSARLAGLGARVHSVERDRRAVAAAEAGGPAAPAVTRHAGAAERVVSALPRPELVLTNPPRGGMHEAVTAAIAAAAPARVVYVSCDPATLARDLGRLPGLTVTGVRAFDLFPQTAHVETVVCLERR